MTDTEKLAELLGKMMDFSEGTLYLMADYLIGKGVVVREKGELEYHCPNCGADMRKGENG